MARYVVTKINVVAIALMFIIGFATGGVFMLYLDLLDKPCHAGEVFVVDTERCISATDGAHVGGK